MIKINRKSCYVDKRKLIFDCSINKDRYIFTVDGWGIGTRLEESLTKNGESFPYTLLSYSKHEVQVAFMPTDSDSHIFIDRAYRHNRSYDVYFEGKHYKIGKEIY